MLLTNDIINFSPTNDGGGGTSEITPTDNDSVFMQDGKYTNFKGEPLFNDEYYTERNIKLNDKGEIIDEDSNVLHDRKTTIDFLLSKDKDINTYLEKSKSIKKEKEDDDDDEPQEDIVFKDGTFVDAKGNDLLSTVFSEEELKTIKFDETGNLVDDKGNILKSVDELIGAFKEVSAASPKDNILSDNLFTELQKNTGIEITDKDGKALSFEPTIEGISSYINAAIDKTKADVSSNIIQGYLKNNPHILTAANYYKEHGSFDGMSSTIDYSKVKIDDNTGIDELKDIIITAHLLRDNDTDRSAARNRANRYAEAISNDGEDVLRDEGKSELEYISKQQEAQIQAENDKAVKAKQDRDAAIINNVNKVKDIINKGSIEIDGVVRKIPKNIKRTIDGKTRLVPVTEFIEYYTLPAYQDKDTGDVFTAYEVDELNRSFEDKLFKALVDYSGGVNQFVEETQGVNNVSVIRDLLLHNKKSNKATPPSSTKKRGINTII